MARTPLALALALGLLLATGCGGDAATPRDASEKERERPRAGTRAAPDPADPTETKTHETPRHRPIATPPKKSPSGNALTIRQTGPDGHLLRADDLGAGWSVSVDRQ